MNRSVDYETPLAYAAKKGQLKMVKLLLDAKASVDGQSGPAPQRATRSGNPQAVQIPRAAKRSLKFEGCPQVPPLFYAVSSGHVHIVNLLLAAKAALVSPSRIDESLTAAVMDGNIWIMKILIDAKVVSFASSWGTSLPVGVVA